jgi:hypothetical protein
MIWNEELSASLDQSGGVVVFHRIELSRAQQLAQTIADKVGAMVEQNEKALDIKMGGTGGWGDRADGNKGEKRGEQTQERRGRGERTRGTRGMPTNIYFCPVAKILKVGHGGVERDLLKVWAMKCRQEQDRFSTCFFCTSIMRYYLVVFFIFRLRNTACCPV